VSDVQAIARTWESTFDRSWRPMHATVQHVVLSDADHAIVTYSLYRGKRVVLRRQPGTAVRRHGRWHVSTAAICAVVALETTPQPPVTRAAATRARCG
jgi:hypothetical protein